MDNDSTEPIISRALTFFLISVSLCRERGRDIYRGYLKNRENRGREGMVMRKGFLTVVNQQ